MKTFELLENVEFSERNAHAEALYSNEDGRALRFAFLPGQELEAHEAPNSPVHMVVLHGKGMFRAVNGEECECGPGMLVAFDAGETHAICALDEKLVYIAIYKENPAALQYESEHRKLMEAEG